MIHTGGEVQVAEVLELSEYLKMVASSTAFPLIVAGLRAQFRPTLLQLAFSYCIEQITSAAPILEPPVWTAGARDTFSEAARAEVERTLFDNHSDVAGVLMVTRRYSESNKRYRYEMRACINESVGGQPISRLIEAEPQLLVPAVNSAPDG